MMFCACVCVCVCVYLCVRVGGVIVALYIVYIVVCGTPSDPMAVVAGFDSGAHYRMSW